MISAVVALAVALALSGGYGWYQREERIVAEGKVTVLETQIGAQNKAVEATKIEGDRRVSQATKGVAASAAVTQAAVNEAKRLRLLNESALPPPTNCPAGAAVAQIRNGLR